MTNQQRFFIQGTDILNPLVNSTLHALDDEFRFNLSFQSNTPHEEQGDSFDEKNQVFETETQNKSINALFCNQPNKINGKKSYKSKAYRPIKNDYEQRKAKNIKKPLTNSTVSKPKALTRNAYQNCKLIFISYLKQFSKSSIGFDKFQEVGKNYSVELYEGLLKEKVHAKDLAVMFHRKYIQHAYMNGRSNREAKIENLPRLLQMQKRFLIMQGELAME